MFVLKGRFPPTTTGVKAINEACGIRGIPVDECLIYSTKAVTYEDGFEVTDELLREHPDVDGVFYTADILALGALQYCLKRNINVPEDLKIIGFDDIAACTRAFRP